MVEKVDGFIVELEKDVWVAPGRGDPGRTLKIENASLFDSRKKAERALKAARKYRPFKGAEVLSAVIGRF